MLPVCKVMRYSTAVQKCVTMEMHQPHNRYDDIKTTRFKKTNPVASCTATPAYKQTSYGFVLTITLITKQKEDLLLATPL